MKNKKALVFPKAMRLLLITIHCKLRVFLKTSIFVRQRLSSSSFYRLQTFYFLFIYLLVVSF